MRNVLTAAHALARFVSYASNPACSGDTVHIHEILQYFVASLVCLVLLYLASRLHDEHDHCLQSFLGRDARLLG